MDKYKVATLNCNGLLTDKLKQYEIKDFIYSNKIDILFLQETHIYNKKLEANLEILFNCKTYFSYGTNRSRGVGILIFNKAIIPENFKFDLDGRFMYVDCDINGNGFRFINVYCPNDEKERVDFLIHIHPYFVCNRKIIFAGDFNCIMNAKLDKRGGNPNSGQKGADQIRALVSDYNLCDSFRYLFPSKISTTWLSFAQNVSCRLDRIYISSTCKQYIHNVTVNPVGCSDHDAVILTFENNTDLSTGSGYWKINNTVLQDKPFRDSFKIFWLNLIDEMDGDQDFWSICKDNIKLFVIEYCKRKNKIKRRILHEYEHKYHTLQKHEQSNPGEYIEQVKAIKDLIYEFQKDSFQGSKIRSRAKVLDNSEKPSKFFFQLEANRGRKKLITKIEENSKHFSTSGDILDQFRNFYTNLFTTEGIDNKLCDYFLDDLPKLSEIDKNIIDEPFTKDEILKALKGMENNKSPGPDGLSKEFYVTFFDIMSDFLLDMYNNIFKEGTLSDDQKLSYITLICKDLEKSHLLKMYRPISLLNVDVKIISKIITNRFMAVMHVLIHPDQTCAVRDRSILDNAHLFRNISDYVEQKNIPCAFVGLDQEKAYDRVEYDFLFEALEKYNFGPNIIKWIKILYTDISSSVIVNNYISDPFPLTRGVKQGCSLSPLLYVLALEPFARKVRADEDISGVRLPGSMEQVKISLYADDSNGICTDDKSIGKLLYWCELYGRASGAKLNKSKTKGLFLGKWKSRSDHPFGISWAEKIKIIGIMFGNNVTADDIWHSIYIRFCKVLNTWLLNRNLSLLEKSMIINSVACGKLWYVGSIYLMPDHYVKLFEKKIFSFLWPYNCEPVSRHTLYLHKFFGGLNVVNIRQKMTSFQIRHIQKIIANCDAKFTFFSIYWIGLSLRHLNSQLARNSIPHTDQVPLFYLSCLKSLRSFTDKNPDISLDGLKTKVKIFII